jgi:hypothetical protein
VRRVLGKTEPSTGTAYLGGHHDHEAGRVEESTRARRGETAMRTVGLPSQCWDTLLRFGNAAQEDTSGRPNWK